MKNSIVLLLLLLSFVLIECGKSSEREVIPEGELNQDYYGELQEPSEIDTVTIKLFDRDAQDVIYETYDSLDIIDGDIIIKDRTMAAKFEILGNVEFGRAWPGGKVPYLLSQTLTNNIRENIEFAIAHWESVTSIRFEECKDQTKPHILFRLGKSSTIGSSLVGMVGGRQIIYLGSGTGRPVAIHEIGHSLGLWHEQSRPDRESYVKILWSNIKRRNQFNFAIKGNESGDYDFKSRMHYKKNAFSKNGGPTIIPLDSQNEIINDGYLSTGDLAAIKKLY